MSRRQRQAARLARISSQAQIEADDILAGYMPMPMAPNRAPPESFNALKFNAPSPRQSAFLAPLPSYSDAYSKIRLSGAASARRLGQTPRNATTAAPLASLPRSPRMPAFVPTERTNMFGNAYHPNAGHMVPEPPSVAAPSERGTMAARMLQGSIDQRFKTLNKAFLSMDQDRSNHLDKAELLKAVTAWNLQCSPADVDALLASCDDDGNGHIDYNEFQRGMARLQNQRHGEYFGNNDTQVVRGFINVPKSSQVVINDNLHSMGAHQVGLKPDYHRTMLPYDEKPATRTQMKGYVHSLEDKINTKYKMMRSAFRAIDADKNGHLSPDELISAVENFALPIPISHVSQMFKEIMDVDSNGKLSYAEFVDMVKNVEMAQTLGK